MGAGTRVSRSGFLATWTQRLTPPDLGQRPVDTVKIDQTFIADLAHHTMSNLIVEAIVSVAHTAGLSVTAEGVETADQPLPSSPSGATPTKASTSPSPPQV
jgi:predicted signal transduction protein with EAL and GGDEF domain